MLSMFQRSRDVNAPEINVVFDIDDCIATGFSKSELSKPYVQIFQREGLLIEAIEPHIIFPGVIEFIQALNAMPNVTTKVQS